MANPEKKEAPSPMELRPKKDDSQLHKQLGRTAIRGSQKSR